MSDFGMPHFTSCDQNWGACSCELADQRIKGLEAENARLRAALRDILDSRSANPLDIATAALEERET